MKNASTLSAFLSDQNVVTGFQIFAKYLMVSRNYFNKCDVVLNGLCQRGLAIQVASGLTREQWKGA